ncbi:hypothetical protein [Candidatus Methanarcanum hacksteinii]|uniref:hypothetical protein n=1 Tax=Candidatus Methanarcanum hacksteinii TaxID=2911857 RepID=UPI0037DDB8E8
MSCKDGRPIESIDSRHMMSIILFIHENGPCRKMDIYQGVSRNASMPAKFQQMIDCGIMEVGRDDGCSVYSLTESGRKIAEHLECIEDLII